MVSCGKRSINPSNSGSLEGFKARSSIYGQQLNQENQGGPKEGALQASDPINLIFHASSRLLTAAFLLLDPSS